MNAATIIREPWHDPVQSCRSSVAYDGLNVRREALGAFAMRAAKVMLFLGALVLCVVKLRASFWLDETVTYWVVKDGGLVDAMRRTLDFPPQSLGYTPIAWAAVK